MIILAAVDLSSASVDAARTALGFARRLGDELLLVHAVEPLPGVPSALPGEPGAPLDHRTHAANLEALKNLRTSLDAGDVGVEVRVIEGRPFDALMACAEQTKPRLIVMGSHGRRAVARLLLGSVTQKVLLASPCPVLVCREGTAPLAAWTTESRPLRVTAGIDRGPTGAFIVKWLETLRGAGPTDITLLHEYWPAREHARLGLPSEGVGATPPQGEGESQLADLAGILERELREDLRSHGISDGFTLRVCPVQGPVSEQLGIDAQAEAADLLVITTPHPTHGRPPTTAWGSTAAATMSATRVPLLVLPVG